MHRRGQVVQLGGDLLGRLLDPRLLDPRLLGAHRLDERGQLPQPGEAVGVEGRVVAQGIERFYGLVLQVDESVEVEPFEARRDLKFHRRLLSTVGISSRPARSQHRRFSAQRNPPCDKRPAATMVVDRGFRQPPSSSVAPTCVSRQRSPTRRRNGSV
ncbi:hypothetical protein NCC78_28085 [Micromonospora phytophila]|uniref:hypothetical protein n=1 Tax=Micromonospora phytophila TaxID=709888 RepID=UPI00203082D8|nr:hypothetical protein [Micromonospora phytophila]MCM0678504.1 hypothetical protein [Micromonospora phytophila]